MLGTLVRLLPPAARAMVRLHLARRSESAPVHAMRRSWTVLNQNLLMSLDGLLLAKPVPSREIVQGSSGESARSACSPGFARAMITAYSRRSWSMYSGLMGLRTWVKQQLGMAPASASVDLLQATLQELPAPRRLGLDLKVPAQAWSTARLTLLFREAALQPSVTSLQAARLARNSLSFFWLTAPVDQLEALYASDLGELQRFQLAGPLVHQPLAIDEKQWRDQLLALVTAPAERFRLVNLLLALLPYTRPGQFQIERATDLLPDWFIRDYADHCDPQLKHQLD